MNMKNRPLIDILREQEEKKNTGGTGDKPQPDGAERKDFKQLHTETEYVKMVLQETISKLFIINSLFKVLNRLKFDHT